MQEAAIKEFWTTHPCGDHLVGGLDGSFAGEYEEFFKAYDEWRYTTEYHIPSCLDDLHVAGKSVLEIGLGQGAESEQLIRRGATWSGVDLTSEAVHRTETRLRLRGLDFAEIRQGSVLDLPFDNDQFDLVFSHGVLHHVPDIHGAQREIYRVLKPGGELVVMLYARHSLNYQVAIRIVRRAGLLAAYPLWQLGAIKPRGMLAEHLQRAKAAGLLQYLELESFTHRSTDGPANPYARVYSRHELQRAFPLFRLVRAQKHYAHAPPLALGKARRSAQFQRLLGWHLWAHLTAQ
jgi:ubiquinone/menaquinone biosynthesis C-methylase UbiE